jgi:hypothetical protein
MKRESFLKLVDELREPLHVNQGMGALRGGAIPPEIALYLTVHYLAGGAQCDISEIVGISIAAFYLTLHKILRAIIDCKALDIVFPSTPEECHKLSTEFMEISEKDSIINCVGAVDGYLLSIDVPNKEDAGNVCSFFSVPVKTFL